MTFVDRLFPRSRAAVNGTPPAVRPAPAPDPPPAPQADIHARRRALAQELADRQWDLGGMTYEMAIRDHFRLDVLVMHASRLQQIDAELAEIERQIRLGDAGAAGECPACGAAHSRGAVYCWSCGAQLIPVETAGT
jgi:predicted RNA-binding Zn-ribbon protein involved in translation (DUF1610 family)